jgi:hypothetical protein
MNVIRLHKFPNRVIFHRYYIQGHLNNIIGPRAKQYTGTHIYTTTHRNKTVNVDKIKHIFIVLVFPSKSVFKHLRNHALHSIHRLSRGVYAHGAPKQLPSVPML